MSNFSSKPTAQLAKATPQNDFKGLLKSQWPKIASVMPKSMSSERLFQLAVSTYNSIPKLAEATPVSVLSCVMKCAALGLEPSAVDGLGRAYILPYNNRKTGHTEAQFMLGYKGMIDLARRSGELKSIHAQAVYVGDEYDVWEDEHGQHFTFKPKRGAEHSEKTLTDVFVNAQLMNGGFVFETMTKEEIDAIRKRSKAANNGPWVSDYEAMAKKTVIRSAFKYLPVSVEAKSAVASDETTPNYDAVLNPVIEPEAVEVPSNVDTETGEVLEPEVPKAEPTKKSDEF